MLCKMIFYNTLIILDEIILGTYLEIFTQKLTRFSTDREKELESMWKKDTTIYFLVGLIEVSAA